MSLLFSPIALGPLTLKNRIVIAPMCQYSADEGRANDWHLVHLGQLMQSDAGLLVIEATAVEADGRITPGCLGLWSDEHETALGRVIGALRTRVGATMPLAIQLSHAGRKASSRRPWDGGMQIPLAEGGWLAQAPSALPHLPTELAPREMGPADLARVQQAFVAAALRALRIGIEAIELHAAHGYLLHQFLSPIANQRTDEYGGSAENRMRFPLAVFDAVRAAMPASVPVGLRLSATDWVDGGWDIEQSVAFGRALRARGCGFIDVSSGGISPLQKLAVGPGYQVGLAERIRHDTGLPTMAVGLITEPEQAEGILAEGRADMVAMARALLYNPRWPWHAAAKLGAQVQAPRQYWRSQPQGLGSLFGEVRIGHR